MSLSCQSRCFIDGHEYQIRDLEAVGLTEAIIKQVANTCGGGKFVFAYCGFIVCKNEVIVIFPKEYIFSKEKNSQNCKILAGALMRYRDSGQMDEEERELLGVGESAPEGSIATALFIIEDYLRYGLLRREHKVERLNGNGRIHWPKTIQKYHPVLADNTPYYFETVTHEKNKNTSNLLTCLHAYTVGECIKKYGWLLGISTQEQAPPVQTMPCSTERAEYILEKELHTCFREREINILKLLKSYTIGGAGQDETMTINTFGTRYFHRVWEAACRYTFGHCDADKKYIPQPCWTRAKTAIIEYTHQIPDIIYEYNEHRYILDAKYYSLRRRLPGWGDLVKQFFYGFTFTNKTLPCRNAMIFNGHHDVREMEKLIHIGNAYIDETPEMGKILGFTADTFTILDSYRKHSSILFRQNLDECWSTIQGE